MTDFDVVVVGAGASGLMAARQLSKQNKKVAVLEARSRTGGRIFTMEDAGFTTPAEAGAEFIHGNLPVTIELLNEAGISYHRIEGETFENYEGRFLSGAVHPGDEAMLKKHFDALQEDVDVATFLNTHFGHEKYSALVGSIKGYVEGYDAADPSRASTFALRDEWTGDTATVGDQFRVKGGYGQLIRFLENQCRAAGCSIHLSTLVQYVKWNQNQVEVITGSQQKFTCKKLVVTIPLGLLQTNENDYGAILFSPNLPHTFAALKSLGFGNVIKILLEFKEAFWKNTLLVKRESVDLDQLGWLFTDAAVPTWWTQLPEQSSLLTGWVAGPKAALWRDKTDDDISNQALESLSAVFNLPREQLVELLSCSKVINWSADPLTRGAYAYSTVHTTRSILQLEVPVENTLFFAGEALHDGPEMGTVEGALTSGKMVAERVVSVL